MATSNVKVDLQSDYGREGEGERAPAAPVDRVEDRAAEAGAGRVAALRRRHVAGERRADVRVEVHLMMRESTPSRVTGYGMVRKEASFEAMLSDENLEICAKFCKHPYLAESTSD